VQLSRSTKFAGTGTHRVMSADDTLRRVRPIVRRIGITRLADITGLDRIGIPVYSAIMPRSRDCISVYNGKGATAADAKVGALMEGIERYSAWSARRPDCFGSYKALRADHRVLDPTEIVAHTAADYSEETEIAWIEGYDLIQKEQVLVPYYAAAYFDGPGEFGHLCYAATSTNGLASGNTLEEAICHALCEIIERDAWTLAELVSLVLPRYVEKRLPGLFHEAPADDLERYPSIDLDTIDGLPAELLRLYRRAGMTPVIRNLTSDTGIPTILCTISDDLHERFSPAHAGAGAHPDATVALTRALTEAAQARAVDMQGLREDLAMADEEVHETRKHCQRVARTEGPNFFQTPSARPIALAAVPTHRNADILDDIELMLARLRRSGMECAIAVDFSMPMLESSVARVIVPGAESWAAVKGRIGRRAERRMREVAVARTNEAAAKENRERILNALFSRVPRP
jgi:ribosomal protein S12 methylthiotransferase accessory factor